MKGFQRERKKSAFPWLACCLWRHPSSVNVEFNLHINLQQKGKLESLFQFENALVLGICREKGDECCQAPTPSLQVSSAGEAFLSGPVTRHGSIFYSSPDPESALLFPWGVLSHTFMAGLHQLQQAKDVAVATTVGNSEILPSLVPASI